MMTIQASQLLALLVVGTLAFASAQNVSQVLLQYPQFSTFTQLMVDTGVASEVESRLSVSVLLPANDVLDPYVAAHPEYTTQTVADLLRYHVLLQYLGGAELALLSASGYTLTTLYQTTGRASNSDGTVNLTRTDGTVTVGPSAPLTPPQANIITNVSQYPYNYSFLQISAVLEPPGIAPASFAPLPAPELAPEMSPAYAPVEGPSFYSPMSAPEASADGPSGDLGVVAVTNGAYTVGFTAGAAVVTLALAALLV